MDVNVIYEDNSIIVCHKKPGVPTQTNRPGQMDMVHMIMNYRADKKEEPYVGLVHRLDQPVEGVMVFAKTKSAAKSLSSQVAKHEIVKQYYAVVNGIPKEDSKILKDYLLKDGGTNTSKVVSEKNASAKYAELQYEVIEKKGEQCLLKVTLHTGRHHQIRVQLSNAGIPILGDRKYGKKETTEVGIPLALCSFRLVFEHPKTHARMEFTIEPSGDAFKDFFSR